MEATKFTKRGHQDTIPSAFLFELVRLVAQGKIKNRGKLVVFATLKNVLDFGEQKFFANDLLVEFMEVVDGANRAIFLGNCEQRHSPFCLTHRSEHADTDLAFKFFMQDFRWESGTGYSWRQ